MMTQVYLIRHGEAEGNVFRRLHGQYDSLLLPRAYRQMEHLKRRFENIAIDGCFSSDLTRAMITAQSIYVPKNLPLQTDEGFREINVGVWEDIPYGYLDNFYPELMRRFSHDPKHWQVCGSETYKQYTDRFIEAMIQAAKRFNGGTVAIFCHGAVLRGTLMRLFFNDEIGKLPISDNTGVCCLRYDGNKFTYDYLNDNSHIPEELSTLYIQSWWRSTDNRKEANLYFEPSGNAMTAVLQGRPIGYVQMDAPVGQRGIVETMEIESSMEGRGYADQLLGCAISHFRRLGCTELELLPGTYPDRVDISYGFDCAGRTRVIDPKLGGFR